MVEEEVAIRVLRYLAVILCTCILALPGVPQAHASNPEQKVIDLVNAERARHGLPSLTLSNELTNSARAYASAMAAGGFFGHNAPDGSTLMTRNEAAGYHGWTILAENLAGGQQSPEEVVAAWMASESHRANILSPKVREIGVGYILRQDSKYRHYWVQEFGARPGVATVAAKALPAPSKYQFVHGFKVMAQMLPAVVGEPLEDEYHNPENGDTVQRTTKGLLVWRKTDNWTAFTNGHYTWVNGPYGVQRRLNTERFVWEGGPQYVYKSASR